uniref:Uncharacterized protein n=1 Tax=Romanomermis culicivorax TaxID=13658 RepID=A0A915L761_ROMCU
MGKFWNENSKFAKDTPSKPLEKAKTNYVRHRSMKTGSRKLYFFPYNDWSCELPLAFLPHIEQRSLEKISQIFKIEPKDIIFQTAY